MMFIIGRYCHSVGMYGAFYGLHELRYGISMSWASLQYIIVYPWSIMNIFLMWSKKL